MSYEYIWDNIKDSGVFLLLFLLFSIIYFGILAFKDRNLPKGGNSRNYYDDGIWGGENKNE